MKLMQITEIDGNIVLININQIISIRKAWKVHGNSSTANHCTIIHMTNNIEYSVDGSVEDFFKAWKEMELNTN